MYQPLVTFAPGPSQLFPQMATWMQEAVASGLLSASHRGKDFDSLSAHTLKLLHEKLHIPADYHILYTSSATESWEIIPQSLTHAASFHAYTGAFGEKWYDYAHKLRPASTALHLGVNDPINVAEWPIGPEHEVICITQNETSNGTQIQPQALRQLRALHPEKLIAVDVTSSMNGIALPWQEADVWYGSVQKCFGMPAGLGLLIVSPEAVKRAQHLGERKHYNSLLLMLDHIAKYQTTNTPNVLGIYLLNRVLDSLPPVETRLSGITIRANELYEVLSNKRSVRPLVSLAENRSATVLAVAVDPEALPDLKKAALQEGLQLGSGYGKWKETTFRIANFPAIDQLAWGRITHWLSHLG